MDNFDFLKKTNNELYKIIIEAEKLFRDEYFEQAIVQIRCYAEKLAKDSIKDKITAQDTFDDVIQKIKDNSFENIRMQEFTEDLYFIKKNGNQAAHEGNIGDNGEIALECLERAFEIGIFYSHIKNGFDETLDKRQFSEELLITGKQTKKSNLKENYVKALDKSRKEEKSQKSNLIKTIKKQSNPPIPKRKSKTKKETKTETTSKEKCNAVKIIFSALIILTLIIIALFILKILQIF